MASWRAWWWAPGGRAARTYTAWSRQLLMWRWLQRPEISDKELGIVVAQVRNYLSVTFIRAQSLCLLNRLGFLGEGAKAAAGMRDLAKRLEEGRRRERQASYLAHVRGQGLSRTGQIFVM